MKLNFIVIVSFCILIISCKKEAIITEDIEPEIIANGILNGKNWNAYLVYLINSNDYLSFQLYQKKDEIGCPYHEISFRFVPINTGSYILKSSHNSEPVENTVYNTLYYTCGDAMYAFYNVDNDQAAFINITSVTEKKIKGNFTATYIVSDDFPSEVPQKFEFSNVEFELEL